MQNNIERKQMSKIRMNTELRNKLFNKIKHTFENEDTQEKEAFFQAEDGIRDRSPSRGLGDVYKRQIINRIRPLNNFFCKC